MLGVVEQTLPLVRMTRQPVDDARQRRGDGVESGQHEEERDVDDVLARERLAVDLGGDEPADEVVTRFAARLAPVEFGVEVLDHLGVGGDAVVVVGRADDPVLEPDEEVEVVERQAEQGEEHHRRQRLAERVVQLDATLVDEAVDEIVGESAHRGASCATTLGAKSGSSSLRYLVWSSPSSISGIRGRPTPMNAPASSISSGLHRVDVAPLRDLEDVVETQESRRGRPPRRTTRGPVSSACEGRLDVGHPVLEDLGEEGSGSVVVGHACSVAHDPGVPVRRTS